MSFIEKLRQSQNAGNRMINKLKEANETRSYNQENFYYPETDENKNASVVIRFLPQADPDALPYATSFHHWFKKPNNKWSPRILCGTTFGKECPICAANSQLWETGDTTLQDVVRARKRKKEYYANILVISDPKKPDNEGKVFVYKFGATVYDKLMEAVTPKFETDPAFDPFDVFEGANFNLRVVFDNNKRQITYESSKFESQSSIGSDLEIEAIMSQVRDLSELCNEGMLPESDFVDKLVAECYSGYTGTPKPSYQSTPAPATEKYAMSNDEIPWPDESETTTADADDVLSEFEKMINS